MCRLNEYGCRDAQIAGQATMGRFLNFYLSLQVCLGKAGSACVQPLSRRALRTAVSNCD